MNDKELLEYAAKAAGIEVYWCESNSCYWLADESDSFVPLDNDGDALRLAVKLRMDLLFDDKAIEANATYHSKQIDGETIFPWSWESIEPDPYAATRRTIVRVAAAIGKEQA